MKITPELNLYYMPNLDCWLWGSYWGSTGIGQRVQNRIAALYDKKSRVCLNRSGSYGAVSMDVWFVRGDTQEIDVVLDGPLTSLDSPELTAFALEHGCLT